MIYPIYVLTIGISRNGGWKGMQLQTVKNIVEKLKMSHKQETWIDELKKDQRLGVQQALKRWEKRIEKIQLIENDHRTKELFDTSYAPFDGAFIAGVDEAGRGPLAGPVVTASVILPKDTHTLLGLDDSKAISKKERERYASEIKRIAVSYSVHIQSAEKIDELNIYVATKESMEKAVQQLTIQPDFVIVDAMPLNLSCKTASVIKGDAKSLAVAAASIIAKTERDNLMDELHNDFPMYNFRQNAGYGTKEHLEALRLHGSCIHHRKSFEPVKSM